jgi:hypothetical protein
MSPSNPLASILGAVCTLPFLAAAHGQTNYTERLGEGSTYRREDCVGICACHVVNPPGSPMTGTFTLVFDHSDTWTSYYTVTGASFTSSTALEPSVQLEGVGTYHIGGDFALTQHIVLDLVPVGGGTTYHYDSGEVVITGGGVQFPAISITATTGIVGCTRRTLVINAAPGAPACAADIGSTGGVHGADGQLDNNDFVIFVDDFFNADPEADRGTQGGTPGSDGVFDNNDFIVFIDQFFNATGC